LDKTKNKLGVYRQNEFRRLQPNKKQYPIFKANEVNKEFSIQNMGEDIVDYLELWDYEKFNLFEGNIEKINQSIFTQDIGIKKTFYPNGMFIKYDELNRLEKACEKMKDIIERQTIGLRKIPFILGRFKEVRI